MHSFRNKRLVYAAWFSFGAICGVLCFKKLPVESIELCFQKLSDFPAGKHKAALSAFLLIWPLLLGTFGMTIFGGVFTSLIVIVCGFFTGAAALICMNEGGNCAGFLMALVPFSCCVISFASDLRSFAAGMRLQLRAGVMIGTINRLALLRMLVSIIILLLEAICLVPLELDFT